MIGRREWMAATGAMLLARPAAAQEAWPARGLRIVVPTSPGSGSDTVARFLAEQLGAMLKQTVVVENKPGGNGVIAAQAVRGAAPDGYTLFLATNTHMAVNPVTVKDLPYDAMKDFRFASGFARGPMVFVTNANSRIRSLQELVAAGRAVGGREPTVGSYTQGFQLAAAWWSSVSGTRNVYVNYRGAPEVFTAVLGEELDWAVTDLIAAQPQVKAGKLRGLAISSEARHPELPDVPTVKESGFPEYVNYTWTSVVVRSETPDAIAARLQDAVHRILASQAGRDFVARIGSEPLALAPADMRRFQQSEIERFRRIADGAGIRPG